MEPQRHPRYPFLCRLATLASASAAVIALIVIGAWWSGNITLASLFEEYVPMTLTVAMSVLLLAVASLMRIRSSEGRIYSWLPTGLALGVLLLSFWVLIEFVAGMSSDIDRLLGAGIGTAGGYTLAQTSLLSIIMILAASIAAVMVFNQKIVERQGIAIAALALFVMSVGVVITLGYLYGTPLLYGGHVRPASVLTGVSAVLIGTVLLCLLGPKQWPVSAFLGPSVQARLLRSFLPLMTLLVLISGSLSNRALASSSNPALATAVIALLTAIVVGYIVTRVSTYIGGQTDRANAMLVKTENELRQANEKLNVLGSITRHDALNRLAVVLGRMQLIQQMTDDKDILKQARESLAAAQAVQRIIEFTGEYQKIGSAEPIWIDVEEAFREALRGVNAEAITVEAEVSGLEVLADRMFEKVLVNLVDNSQRHGKNLRKLRLSHRQEGGHLVLVYEDDGGGLSEEYKGNLFKRGHGRHTGLGTFLSKEILEFSGMSICETGKFGVGARFEISVPSDRYRFKAQ